MNVHKIINVIMMKFTALTRLNITLQDMSREQYMRQTDMREFLEKWEFVLQLRDLEQQIWLQGL